MRVYIVDDEPKVRNGLCAAIHAFKPDWPMPVAAAGAAEAWDDPRLWEAELLFLDVRMPGISGFDLLERLREAEPDREVQTVIVSGHAEFEYAQTAIRLGVKEYLLKPVDLHKLSLLLDKLEERAARQLREEGEDALPPAEDTVEEVKRRLPGANPVVQMTARHIISNPGVALKVEELAAMAYVHANYLSDLFRRETGVKLSAFILDNRVLAAKRELRDPSKKIYMVASHCGFRSQHYFSCVFRRRTGMTPQQYRARFGAEQGMKEYAQEEKDHAQKSDPGR